MLKDLFKGDILLFLLRVFLLVVCLACSFDVFFVKDGSLVMENLFKFMSWVKIFLFLRTSLISFDEFCLSYRLMLDG
jgi:hypothetical protein